MVTPAPAPTPGPAPRKRGGSNPTPTPQPGASPTQQDPPIKHVKINGFTVNGGYWDHALGPDGTPISVWVQYTPVQLQAEADRAAAQARDKNYHGGATSAPSPQKLPGATSAPKGKASNTPNFGQTVTAPNAFDNFAAGKTGVDYSKAQVATRYINLGNEPGAYLLQQTDTHQSDTLENLLKAFVNSGKGNVAKVQQELINAGFGGQGSLRVTGVADGATIQAYRGMLENTLTLQAAGQHVTPEDFLASLAKVGKSKSTTTTNVVLTNTVQAKQAITTAFGDKLGRKPTDSEVAAFTQAIHAYEQSNPSSETQVTDPSGNLKSATTTDKGTGNLNFVNDFATNYAQTDPSTAPEYHAAQALDFYNAALSTLAGGGINTGNTD